MLRFDIRKGALKSERGVAMVEFAAVLPAMLVILLVSLDIGRMLNQYITMQELVNAGLRVAQSTPDLEQNIDLQREISDPPGCALGIIGGEPDGLKRVFQQITQAVCAARKISGFNLGQVKLRTKFWGTTVPSTDPDYQSIDVTIEAQFTPVLTFYLTTISMHSQASGKYLAS